MSELDRARAGQYVAARRGRLGLSKGQLADLAGIDRKTLYHLERGERWPYPKTLAAIEHALGLAVGDLHRVAAGERPSPGLLADHAAQRMAGLALDWEQLAHRSGLSASTLERIRYTWAPDDAEALTLDRVLEWEPGSTRAVLADRRDPVPAREERLLACQGEPTAATGELLEQAWRLVEELQQVVGARAAHPERAARAVKQLGLAVEALEEELGGAG